MTLAQPTPAKSIKRFSANAGKQRNQVEQAASDAAKVYADHRDITDHAAEGVTVEQVNADIAACQAIRPTRVHKCTTSAGTTAGERTLATKAVSLLGNMRERFKQGLPKDDPRLKRAGVGTRVAASTTVGVLAALLSMLEVCEDPANATALRKASIPSADVEECRRLHDELAAADTTQRTATTGNKDLSRQREEFQLRLEDAVISISLAGAGLYKKTNPALAAAFKALVPRTRRRRRAGRGRALGSKRQDRRCASPRLASERPSTRRQRQPPSESDSWGTGTKADFGGNSS